MDILQKKCPYCNHKISKYLFWLSKKVNNGCKYKINYLCYYCPQCKKQISKGHNAKLELFLGIAIFIIALTLSKFTINFFQILPNFPDPIKIIPLLFFYSVFLMYVYISYVPLGFFEEDKNKEATEVLDEKVLDNDIIITPFESKMKKHMVMSPIYFAIFVTIGFFLLLIVN